MLCIGLDTAVELIPVHLRSKQKAVFEFNRAIIDATADLVCAYKPQLAYYQARGLEDELASTLQYLHQEYPHIPIILDGKRGDIADTAALYAEEAFIRYAADALTVNPYLGGDSLKPFTDYEDRGVILLCCTSNLGSGDLQDLPVNGRPLYQILAQKAANEWNEKGNILLVVGATHPTKIKAVRGIVGNMPLLVPGIGTQGGSLEAVLENGLTKDGYGLIINASRSILYAGKDESFAQAAREAALLLHNAIQRIAMAG